MTGCFDDRLTSGAFIRYMFIFLGHDIYLKE